MLCQFILKSRSDGGDGVFGLELAIPWQLQTVLCVAATILIIVGVFAVRGITDRFKWFQ